MIRTHHGVAYFPPLWFMVTQMRMKGVFDVTQLHGRCSVVELEPTLC
jgi:hypothetical protein